MDFGVLLYLVLFSLVFSFSALTLLIWSYDRGAGSKLKVGGTNAGAKRRKKFFFCAPPPHFSVVPPSLGGTAHTRVGTKMGSHSPLFVRKEMACS